MSAKRIAMTKKRLDATRLALALYLAGESDADDLEPFRAALDWANEQIEKRKPK
jgi:hypothetical protein